MPKRILMTLLLLAVSPVLAQDSYAVDSAGGPLTLSEDVEAAFMDWLDAGVAEVPAEQDPALNLFRFAEPDLLGPDTLTLTLQRPESRPQLEILIHPDLYRDNPAALRHEAGLLLGLSPLPEGVMRPGQLPGNPAIVTAEDALLVRSAATAVPGDLTRDGTVDFYDLLELAAQYGRRGLNLPADLDGDGMVTEADLVELRSLYEFLPPLDPAAADSEEALPDQEPDSSADGTEEPADGDAASDPGQADDPGSPAAQPGEGDPDGQPDGDSEETGAD